MTCFESVMNCCGCCWASCRYGDRLLLFFQGQVGKSVSHLKRHPTSKLFPFCSKAHMVNYVDVTLEKALGNSEKSLQMLAAGGQMGKLVRRLKRGSFFSQIIVRLAFRLKKKTSVWPRQQKEALESNQYITINFSEGQQELGFAHLATKRNTGITGPPYFFFCSCVGKMGVALGKLPKSL